jgi:hypothetical protein
MKKALIGLLILAIAGGVFAQEVNFGGGVTTGLWIDIQDGADEIGVRGDDDDSGDAIHAWFDATYDAGDWGVALGSVAGFDSDPENAKAGSLEFYNAHGWMKFVDGMLTLRAGMIDPAVWNTAIYTAAELDDNLSSGGGLRLEVTPIDGLNLGAFFSYPNGGSLAGKIANFFQETALGFSYGNDMFGISATLKLYSEEDLGYREADSDMKLIFGFGFMGIPGLAIGVEGKVDHLGAYSDAGEIEVWEEVDYTLGPLSFGVHAKEILLGHGDVSFSEFMAKPLVSYAVTDEVTVGADVPITMADIGDGLGFASFGVNAWLKYAFTGDVWMKLGYGFTSFQDNYGRGLAGGAAALDHYIKLIFKYAF